MLTDEEIKDIARLPDMKFSMQLEGGTGFARAIERAVLAKAMPIPKQEPVINGEAVWIVATGEHYGQHESYTLHDECPALCEGEKLYRSFSVNYDVGLIAEMLEDYGLLLRNGTIDSAHRYPPATVMEQVNLLLSEPQPAQAAAIPDNAKDIIQRLASELESEIEARHTEGMMIYPSIKSKYDADMSTVIEARAMLSALPKPE